MKNALRAILLLACLPVFAAGGLERVFEGGGASATVRVDPAAVPQAGTVDVSIALSAPPAVAAAFAEPDLGDRFEGFDTRDSYTDENDVVHFRLAPRPAAPRYRIRPVAVKVTDRASGKETWFATEAMVLPAAEHAAAADTVSDASLRRRFALPPARVLLRYALFVLAFAALVTGVVFLVRALARRVKLARLTPKARALHELGELLEKRLPERGRVKDFYVELTHVVRRYIERRYGILAPRQTTEEFLAAAMKRSEFPADTLSGLAAFLESADLVKFAGIEASVDTAANAASKAESYLRSEREETEK